MPTVPRLVSRKETKPKLGATSPVSEYKKKLGRTKKKPSNAQTGPARSLRKERKRGGTAETAAKLPRSKRLRPSGADASALHYVEPMKALGVTEISGDNWLLEIKYDGYRALGIKRGELAELWSRNEKSLTENYREIATALGKLRCRELVIDGEIVALDPEGRPTFQLLQGIEMGQGRPPLYYFVFDLLNLNGRSFLQEPIEVRKAALEKVVKGAPDCIRLSLVFKEEPDVLLEAVRQKGLEGIVGKLRGSFYEPGRRSGAWVKKRLSLDQEFVIGGYTPPRGGRSHFGALLVGFYDGNTLMYAGKVGTGFNTKLLASLHQRFKAFTTDHSPFGNLPTKRPRFGLGMTVSAMKDVTWLKPELVAQVKFSEWTRDAMLRQPVFLGLREDKPAREVVREITSSDAP